MNLDDAQKQKIRAWIEEGLKLSEIQAKLASELGLRLTYMEVRFLLDDLKLKPKDRERAAPAASIASENKAGTLSKQTVTKDGGGTEETSEEMEEELEGGPGGVTVTVDQVARPGALVSGKVTFSDQNSAEWHLDQMGRLSIAPKQQGYRPSQQDLLAFQTELQSALAKLGF